MKLPLSLALACATLSVYAQTPQPVPPRPQPGMQPPPFAGSQERASETSRISHLLEGPDGYPQALLLRNGTFVTLSPGLSQQLPVTMHRDTKVHVNGMEFSHRGNKTIQAQNITIAGIAYNDAPGAPGRFGVPGGPAVIGALAPPPPPNGAPVPPPPPPHGAPMPPPKGAPAPPPPPPCGSGAMQPPPPPPNGATPPPAPPNGTTPPRPSPAGRDGHPRAGAPVPPPSGDAPAAPAQPSSAGSNLK